MNTSQIDPLNMPPALAAVIEAWGEKGKQHWIPVAGESMLPLLQPGDQVLVSHNYADIRPGDIIVIWQAGRLLIHRIIRIGGDGTHRTIFTKGDNARQFDSPVGAEEIIGKAIALKRRGRQISLLTNTWRVLGWLIATTARVNANLLDAGSRIKQIFLGSNPNRLTRFLRFVLSRPFDFILKILAALVRLTSKN